MFGAVLIVSQLPAADAAKMTPTKYTFHSLGSTNDPNEAGCELQVQGMTNRIASKEELALFLKGLPPGSTARFQAWYGQFKVRLGTNILSDKELNSIFTSNNVPLDPIFVPDW
jgi:hypothetical protein